MNLQQQFINILKKSQYNILEFSIKNRLTLNKVQKVYLNLNFVTISISFLY